MLFFCLNVDPETRKDILSIVQSGDPRSGRIECAQAAELDATFRCRWFGHCEGDEMLFVDIWDGTKHYPLETDPRTDFTVDGSLFDQSVFGKELTITARGAVTTLTLTSKFLGINVLKFSPY